MEEKRPSREMPKLYAAIKASKITVLCSTVIRIKYYCHSKYEKNICLPTQKCFSTKHSIYPSKLCVKKLKTHADVFSVSILTLRNSFSKNVNCSD